MELKPWALAEELDEPFLQHKLFGGEGTVKVWELLGPGAVPPFASALACELEPGGHVGKHVQQEHAEIVIFLEGEGVVTIQGQSYTVGPGSVAPLRLGEVLEIQNATGDLPLRYLIVKAG